MSSNTKPAGPAGPSAEADPYQDFPTPNPWATPGLWGPLSSLCFAPSPSLAVGFALRTQTFRTPQTRTSVTAGGQVSPIRVWRRTVTPTSNQGATVPQAADPQGKGE